jgi:hypothetical protein
MPGHRCARMVQVSMGMMRATVVALGLLAWRRPSSASEYLLSLA